MNDAKSRVLVGARFVWLAWYPLRGRRSQLTWDETRDGGWHVSAALGSLYLGIGTGVPLP